MGHDRSGGGDQNAHGVDQKVRVDESSTRHKHGRLGVGAESTAHTLSFGAVQGDGSTLPAAIDTIRPTEGGIHPREAADHHRDVAQGLLNTFSNVMPSTFQTSAVSRFRKDLHGALSASGRGDCPSACGRA